MTADRAYENGTEAFVAEAIVDGGVPAVLKLAVPVAGDAASNEGIVMREDPVELLRGGP